MDKLKIELSPGVRSQVIVSLLGAESIVVDISKSINKTEISDKKDPYGILVRVLKYYGREEMFYNKLKELYEGIVIMEDAAISKGLKELVAILSTEEILKYLDSINYKSPYYLRDAFTEDIVINNEGNRERTYIKQDYKDLVVLVIKLKLISLVLARYIYIFDININDSTTISIFRLIDGLKDISSLPGYKKLVEYVKANIGGDDNITEFDISRVMNKGITPLIFPKTITASISLFLGIAGSPDDDANNNSLVSHLSRLCKNKNSLSKNIMLNNPNLGGDDDNDQSVADAYTSTSKVPLSVPVALLYAFGTVDGDPTPGMTKILRQVRLPYDKEYLNVSDNVYKALSSRMLKNSQITILSWLFFDIIESEYITKYFNMEINTNLRIVAYAILKTAGLNSLADIIMSTSYEDGIFMSKSGNRQADPELEEAVSDILLLGISKKNKSQKFGLSIMDDDTNIDLLKELIFGPPVMEMTNTRWLGLHLPKGKDSTFTVKNAREEMLKLMLLSRNNLKA